MKINFYPLILFLFLISTISSQELTMVLYAGGFNSPVELKHAGDDRMFVVEKTGKIFIINQDGSVEATPFLDLSALISGQFEQGLLGLAFHPDYTTNGFFYVNYTDLNGDTQLDRFTVSGDPNVADFNSRLNLLSIEQPSTIHNGGCLNFGPDNYLYMATGDGQGGGDPNMNAQNTTVLLGKILRLDVDNPSGGNNYGIPPGNPFAGSTTDAEEVWAYGLRNPWKFSFDSLNGDFWLGDVGNNNFEEVNHVSGNGAGTNFGWRCYEAYNEFILDNCPATSTLTFPVYAYEHVSDNCNAITGGIVYRGTDDPDFEGLYFFADFCRGFIWALNEDYDFIDFGRFWEPFSSFGVNSDNELFIVSRDGEVYRLRGENLGNEDKTFSNSIVLTPNPASDSLRVSSTYESMESLSIHDLNGKLLFIMNELNNNHKTIDISQLNSGIYLVSLTTSSGQTLIEKLVVD